MGLIHEWRFLFLLNLFILSIFIQLRFMSKHLFEFQKLQRGENNHSTTAEERVAFQRTTTTTVNASPSPSSLLWEVFMENNSKCFFIDDFCHSSYRWFYHPHGRSSDRQQQLPTASRRQPRFEFKTDSFYYSGDRPYFYAGYPEKIAMEQLQEKNMSMEQLYCKYSNIPNHVVLYSEHNHMLGEFYDRGLTFFYEQFASSFGSSSGWFENNSTITASRTAQTNESSDQFSDFLESTQLYLHLEYPTRKIMDSHQLFTSFFRTHPLLDLTVLLHEPTCQCFDRVAFCGYEVTQQQKPVQLSANNTTAYMKTSQNETTILTAKLDTEQDYPGSSPETYSGLRNLFRRRVILDNPFLQSDIQQYRKEVFLEHGVVKSMNETGGLDAWRIVGLTQRTSRRRWLNLEFVQKAAGKRLRKDKIILVQVNVEEQGWNPYTQLIRHAALDGLVGIHGAQLTEAIWMPPGSLVVELLPYVPKEKFMGQWTRTTNKPTPLGRIYTGSDLNHVGVPLDIESAPYCVFRNGTSGCWLVEQDKTDQWDDRDFQVDSRKIYHVVHGMMELRVRTESCNDYLKVANKEFVLYNLNCKENEEQEVAPRHFYWKNQ